MSYRETSKPASPMNFNNITYVKVNKDKQGIHLPDRKEIDETLEKYNPIKNLREAKNELLATNAKTLFKRD
jgi:Tfp pilus assembly protein PilP